VLALRSLLQAFGWSQYLLPFIPIAVALEVAHADPVIVFAPSALGVIPTASLMGTATEQLAARSGPRHRRPAERHLRQRARAHHRPVRAGAGLHEVVKASIIGSILGNILLVMGAAMFVGGLKRERQFFDRTAASVQSIMLLLAIAALVMPALFELIEGTGLPNPGDERVNYDSTVEQLSFAVAIVSSSPTSPASSSRCARTASCSTPCTRSRSTRASRGRSGRAVIALAIAGVLVGLMSEILVGSISEASKSIGLSEFFVGVIVVATVGNAAEHWVAVLVASKDKMDLAVNIAIGSSAQIALFVGPLLVLCSFVLGPHPMALVFNGFELGAVILAAVIANQVTQEGESTWFEGLQLLAVYLVFGLAFYFA
jgi:Ca2+:H+ antiporter